MIALWFVQSGPSRNSSSSFLEGLILIKGVKGRLLLGLGGSVAVLWFVWSRTSHNSFSSFLEGLALTKHLKGSIPLRKAMLGTRNPHLVHGDVVIIQKQNITVLRQIKDEVYSGVKIWRKRTFRVCRLLLLCAAVRLHNQANQTERRPAASLCTTSIILLRFASNSATEQWS